MSQDKIGLQRIHEAINHHMGGVKTIEYSVAMVDGSPLYVKLLDKENKVLEHFEVVHPQWWGSVEVDGEEFTNMQIVFQYVRSFFGKNGYRVERINNTSVMYGWTDQITKIEK